MSLSSLPIEILGDIIDRIVNSPVGICGSAPLRRVNRTFDLEIRRSYARTSQFAFDRRFAVAPLSLTKCAFFAKYLLLRPKGKEKGKAEDKDISYHLNDLVDQLLSHEENVKEILVESEHEDAKRYQMLSILCAKMSPVQLSLYPSPIKLPNGKTTTIDLLIAAIYTGHLSLVDHILSTDQINLQSDTSTLFDTALLAAVDTQNPNTVRTLLAHNAPFKPPNLRPSRPFRRNPLLKAVENNDLAILTMLLESSNLCKSDLTYQHALVSSITPSPDSHHITSLLLSQYETSLPESPYILSEGLRAACRAGHTELITHLLASGADVNCTLNYRETHSMAAPIAQAAWTGQVPTIHLLLSHGASLRPSPDGNTGLRTQHPGADALRAATWGNHWPAARALLDAGVAKHLSKTDWCSVFKIAALHAECVDVAAHLLDCGVVTLTELADDEVEAEDAVAELVAIVCQRGNVGFMEALVRHGLPVTGHAMYARAEYPVPVVQALAWGQLGVVRLLEEVMGQKVDGEMRQLADTTREKEMSRGWSRIAAPACGMPAYTILR
ncbi:ankyrin repeat domain-containing protein [Aspergillus melleus]|uniref:ankyrin repeat domain-containing protein n=1 Tax=Aspergillus melleus TaxID=138277 RepID=UPI001E8D0381|nr:uncharacterized protein LDX57_009143 [Aspergillus melleus]KAH8431480.1 hypothetical protein LDX57_009143 [Aspergillus melleus]